MFNLQYLLKPNIRFLPTAITKSHRWNIFDGNKYLNCDQKMSKCFSLQFEDYSFSKDILVKVNKKYKNEHLNNEDIGIIALTYY